MLNSKILHGLNEPQRQAVLHGEGPALVAAGPGSGKTFTITRRLLYLIQERKIPPKEILVITFTKEAARTMQERFLTEHQQLNFIQNNSDGFVSFGTFHSFFYQIIKQISKYKEYQLITPAEKNKIAKSVLLQACNAEITDADVQRLLSDISYFKNTGECNNNFLLASQEEATDQKEKFQLYFDRYEFLKNKYKRIDYDDMLFLCKKELEKDKNLLTHWQNRFSYILVDEAQDMNAIQYGVLKLLSISPYNLFIVGDDDQAIYGFRGSKAGIFHEFLNDYPSTQQINLVENYRCAENIVKSSKNLIEKNKCRVGKELISAIKDSAKGKVEVIGSITAKISIDTIIEKLQNLESHQLHEHAVLFRTNFAMQTFAMRLAAHNIPFTMREKIANLYEHFIVKDVLDYFYAASGEKDRSLYLRLFQKLPIPLGREALNEEKVDLEKVKEVYAHGFYENTRVYEEIIVLERNLNRLKNMRPALGIKYIMHAMEYQKFLLRKVSNNELPQELQQVLDWLMEDAENYTGFDEWNIHMEECKKRLEKDMSLNLSEIMLHNPKGIHLLTLHASKGLEFQKVFIVGLNEGNIPQLRRGEPVTQERIEEERRLFYVGITRAKEELELHYVTGTKERPKVMSRFIKDLDIK